MINPKINNIKSQFEDCTFYTNKIIEKKNKLISAAFLDRDGVIIEDKHYIKNPYDVELCPGAKAFE